MLVLLNIYPAVALIDLFLVPLEARVGIPLWLMVFLGNALTGSVLAVAVPYTARRFAWWPDQPRGQSPWPGAALDVVVVVVLYVLPMVLFSAYLVLR